MAAFGPARCVRDSLSMWSSTMHPTSEGGVRFHPRDTMPDSLGLGSSGSSERKEEKHGTFTTKTAPGEGIQVI